MSQLIGKDPDAGKERRQEKKGTTEDEMARWNELRKAVKYLPFSPLALLPSLWPPQKIVFNSKSWT